MIGFILILTVVSLVEPMALNVTGKSLLIIHYISYIYIIYKNFKIHNNVAEHVLFLDVQLDNVAHNMASK